MLTTMSNRDQNTDTANTQNKRNCNCGCGCADDADRANSIDSDDNASSANSASEAGNTDRKQVPLTKWEYATVPLLVHATKAILDQWGDDGWELVQVVPGPGGSENLVAYLRRPKAAS